MAQTTIAGGGVFTAKNITDVNANFTELYAGSGSSGQAITPASVTATGLVKSSSPTAGIGYATGAGGAVTQITSRTTGVTLNTVCGDITLVSAAGSTTPASFTVTNSACGLLDIPYVCQKSGTDLYTLSVSAKAAGSFQITFNTKSGTTTEQPVFSFIIWKAVIS